MDTSEIIALVALIISFTTALLNYFYTRKRTRQDRPKLLISKVKIHEKKLAETISRNSYYLSILFRNSGKKSTFIDLKMGLTLRISPLDKNEPKHNEQISLQTPLESEENLVKNFPFSPSEEVVNWTYGFLRIDGTFLDHKDNEKDIILFFRGERTDRNWKTLISSYESGSKVSNWLKLNFFKLRFNLSLIFWKKKLSRRQTKEKRSSVVKLNK